MKYQVTQAQYAQCVGDGACEPLDHALDPSGSLPVTGVSFLDAEKYSALAQREDRRYLASADRSGMGFIGRIEICR